MSKKSLFVICLTILLNSFLFQATVMAQTYTRVFDFKKGAAFKSEVTTTSNSTISRGKQVLKVNSKTEVVKTHKIKSVNDEGYKIDVEVVKLAGNIEANKVKTSFNSDTKFDSTSVILQGLSFILNKPLTVTMNKNGAIKDFDEYKLEMATDTLVSFAGIQSEVFKKEELINFLADFTYRNDIKKGYTWTDNLKNGDEESTTKFLVDYIDEKVTILNFFKTVTSKLLNTNTNGTYVVDNLTGLITEKNMYVAAVGYQISAGGVIYAVSRATSIVEKNKMTP